MRTPQGAELTADIIREANRMDFKKVGDAYSVPPNSPPASGETSSTQMQRFTLYILVVLLPPASLLYIIGLSVDKPGPRDNTFVGSLMALCVFYVIIFAAWLRTERPGLVRLDSVIVGTDGRSD